MTENSGRGANKRGPSARAWLTALPLGDGPAADLPLGHALAALDAQWVFLAEKAASSGQSLESYVQHLAESDAKNGVDPSSQSEEDRSRPWRGRRQSVRDAPSSSRHIS